MHPDEVYGEAQIQPPEGMRETRILSMPEDSRYIPEENPSPNDFIILRYHEFKAVVGEMKGGLHHFQVLAQKLEQAVVDDARESFAAAIEEARSQGLEVGYANALADSETIAKELAKLQEERISLTPEDEGLAEQLAAEGGDDASTGTVDSEAGGQGDTKEPEPPAKAEDTSRDSSGPKRRRMTKVIDDPRHTE